MADPPLDRLPTVPQRISDCTKGARPRHGAARVEQEEAAPRKRAGAGQQCADHSQPRDKPRDEYGLRAVPGEERVEPREPRRRQAEQPTMPFEQPSSAAPPDEKPDVVAENRAADRRRDYPDERQAAEARERRAREQDRLAGHGDAGIFEKDTEEDDEVPV